MHGAYLSYYAILAGAPLGLWLSGRRAAAREALLAMMVTFYVCYTRSSSRSRSPGPRYVFPAADNAATAVPLARLTHRLLEGGSAWGTAFPSSHVAVALVAAAVRLARRGAALGAAAAARSRCCSRSAPSTASSTTASTRSPAWRWPRSCSAGAPATAV